MAENSSIGVDKSLSVDIEPYSMTEEILALRLKKKRKHVNAYTYFCAFTLSLGALCFGFVLGWSSPLILMIFEDWEYTVGEMSKYAQIATFVPAGCTVGTFVISVLATRNSRRRVFLIIAPIQFIIWILTTLTDDVKTTYFLVFASGFLSVIFDVEGAELLHSYVSLESFYYFLVAFRTARTLGVLLAYIFGLSEHLTYLYTGISALLVTVYFFCLLGCPEGPAFLFETNPEKARKVLKALRGSASIEWDMKYIKRDAEMRSVDVNARYMLMSKVVYKAIFILFGVCFFQAFTGYHVFMISHICMFTNINTRYEHVFGKLTDGAILGCTYVLSCLIASAVHLKMIFGIRKSLIVSATLVTIMLFCLSAYFFAMDHKVVFLKKKPYIRFILQLLHIVAYEVGYGICPQIQLFDYLPTQVYVYAKPFLRSIHWLLVCLMLVCTRYLKYAITGSGAIFILGVISFFGIIFCSVVVIESRNRTLMQIQLAIGGNPIGSRSVYHSKYRNYCVTNPSIQR